MEIIFAIAGCSQSAASAVPAILALQHLLPRVLAKIASKIARNKDFDTRNGCVYNL
jgi:hypothetical protein